LRNCSSAIDDNDTVLRPIAEKMKMKLEKYESLVCSDIACLARILDPRFPNDILLDSDILRRYVPISTGSSNSSGIQAGGSISKSFYDQLWDDEDFCLAGTSSDEIHRFLQVTNAGDRSIDPLTWWGNNQGRFPSIATVARNVLAIQASFVPSESTFSLAGMIVDNSRCSISYRPIKSCLLLSSWNRFLE